MDCKRKFASIFIFAAALISLSGQALATTLPTLVWCNNCTDAQKKNVAATYPIGTTVFVGDPQNQNYKGWYIDQGWTETQPAQSFPKPTATTATPEENDRIVAVMQFYNLAPVGWQKSISVNYTQFNSAGNVYNYVNPGNSQNVMLSNVLGSTTVTALLLANMSSGIGAFFHITGPQVPVIQITVTFWDGSTLTVAIDTTHVTPAASVVDNSGVDSHENTVLSKKPPDGTTYTFQFLQATNTNPNDYQSWLNQMQLIGYTFATGPATYWACTVIPGSGMHCIHQY